MIADVESWPIDGARRRQPMMDSARVVRGHLEGLHSDEAGRRATVAGNGMVREAAGRGAAFR
jgi:hypothetical protein